MTDFKDEAREVTAQSMNYQSFHLHSCLPFRGEGILCSLSSVRRGLG
jgi:hypothetical protein